MKQDKKKMLHVISKAAYNYEKYLNNKHFLIVFQEGRKTKYVQIGFRNMHFLHLTGVKTHLSAQRFYHACLCGKLAEKDVELDKGGKVQQKLMVLSHLHNLLYHSCWIGDFVNNGVVIRSDYFIGDTKAVLCVGFRHGKIADIPVTLYREDVRKMIQPVNKVLGIFVKRYNENAYSKCTYLAKGHYIDEFILSEEVVIDILEQKEEFHGKQNQGKTVE